MRNRTPQARRLTAVAATATLALVLAACSSGSNATDPTDGTSPSASASVTAGEVGGDPGTWTPLQISRKMKDITVDMRVGQVAQFVEFPASDTGYTVVSGDENVAKATSSTDAEAVFGFVAAGLGQTEVSVYTGSDTDADPVYTVKVNVPNLDPVPAPATESAATPAAEDTPAE